MEDVVKLELRDYFDKRALREYYYGAPDTWTPERGYRALVIEAKNAGLYRPAFEREIAARVFGEWLAENLSKALFFWAGWAEGNAERFGQFLQDHEIELPDNAEPKAFVERCLGAPDTIFPVDCGGGEYGMTVSVHGHIVVVIDTEGNLWVFPEGRYDNECAVKDYRPLSE